MREIPPNDSSRDPATRNLNDLVDVFYQDGWWEGVISEIWPDRVSVYFPATQEYYTDIVKDDPRQLLVRSGYQWDDKGWRLVPREAKKKSKKFAANNDHRRNRSTPQKTAAVESRDDGKLDRKEKTDGEVASGSGQQKRKSEEAPKPPTKRAKVAVLSPQERDLPVDKRDMNLKHLINHGFLAAGDIVYIGRLPTARPGVVNADGSISVSLFRTSCTDTAPLEYKKHVAPEFNPGQPSWRDVFAQLASDGGVRRLMSLRDALHEGNSLPQPVDESRFPLPAGFQPSLLKKPKVQPPFKRVQGRSAQVKSAATPFLETSAEMPKEKEKAAVPVSLPSPLSSISQRLSSDEEETEESSEENAEVETEVEESMEVEMEEPEGSKEESEEESEEAKEDTRRLENERLVSPVPSPPDVAIGTQRSPGVLSLSGQFLRERQKSSPEESVLASAFFGSDSEAAESEEDASSESSEEDSEWQEEGILAADAAAAAAVATSRMAAAAAAALRGEKWDSEEDEPLALRVEKKRLESMSPMQKNQRQGSFFSSAERVKRPGSAQLATAAAAVEEVNDQDKKQAKMQITSLLHDLDDSQDGSGGVPLSPLNPKLTKKTAVVAPPAPPKPAAARPLPNPPKLATAPAAAAGPSKPAPPRVAVKAPTAAVVGGPSREKKSALGGP